jgi:hypothetical protein
MDFAPLPLGSHPSRPNTCGPMMRGFPNWCGISLGKTSQHLAERNAGHSAELPSLMRGETRDFRRKRTFISLPIPPAPQFAEAWLHGPSQPLDASLWIAWLDPDAENGLPALLWRELTSTNGAISGDSSYRGLFPLNIIRSRQAPLEAIIELHGEDIVRLLLRSRSRHRLRPEIVRRELAQNYCVQDAGLTLISRRSGLDLHGKEDTDDKDAYLLSLSSALPFLNCY